MKLTKTVLAVAIAGIAATPMMASATTTLSGAVELKFSGSDSEADLTNMNGEDGFEDGEARITIGDVIVGVAASQALNSGLTGYGSLRIDLNQFSNGNQFAFDEDDVADSGVNLADNVYVGIKGGFGDFRMGEVGNPGEYGQVSDAFFDVGADINQGIGYTGSFGGATVGASYSPAPNQDIFAVGAKFAWNGLSVGVGLQNLDEKSNISASVGFAYAGASIALGFHSVEDGAVTDDETAIKAKVGYSIAGVSLGLTFESEQESEDTGIRFDAGYGLGGGMTVSTRINAFTDGADGGADDSSDWRIMLAKSF